MNTPPANEVLEIHNLGPIKELRIEPKPLTLFIGEQASGKSLAAQMLYFYRDLPSLLAKNFTPTMTNRKNWQSIALRNILDELRSAPFGYFANGRANASYSFVNSKRINWKINITSASKINPLKNLRDDIGKMVAVWKEDKSSLSSSLWSDNIFIPTERAMFTRLFEKDTSTLYGPNQSLLLKRFAEILNHARSSYNQFLYWPTRLKKISSVLSEEKDRIHLEYIMGCQQRSLGGEAYLPRYGQKVWKWRVGGTGDKKIIPISLTSSGQMEAWPFFVIAMSYGVLDAALFKGLFDSMINFYLEEPEAHLHPQAQVEVVKVIAYLVNLGHQFVVTTHSPYIVYKFNNMIQRYLSTGKDFDEEAQEPGLNPEKVCAYRFRAAQAGPPEDILDHRDTQLIEVHELNRVADELSEEFDKVFFAKDK